MIQPIVSGVWQDLAESRAVPDLVFGDMSANRYIKGTAGICVSPLLKGYFENTLPLLPGPDPQAVRPPFFCAGFAARFPLVSNTAKAAACEPIGLF